MTTIKWAGVLTASLTGALIVASNVLLAALSTYAVPPVINGLGIGIASTSSVVAFGAHVFDRADRKVNLVAAVVADRLDALEKRVGDYNAGFVDGFELRERHELSIVPQESVPRGVTRRPH
jgi:hypothetical protein